MKKSTIIFVLPLALSGCLFANQGNIPQIARLSDIRIEQVKNQLVSKDRKARILRPVAGLAFAGLATGVVGYGVYSLMKEKEDKNAQITGVLAGLTPDQIAGANAYIAEQKARLDARKWYEKFFDFTKKAVPGLIGTYLFEKLVMKGYEVMTTGMPSIDNMAEYFITSRTIESFKKTTTYDLCIKDLMAYLRQYAEAELKEFQSMMIMQKLEELQAMEQAEGSLDEELQNERLQMMQQLQELQDSSNDAPQAEQDSIFVRQRIATACSFFVKQVEKVIGYLKYSQATTSSILARVTVGQIITSLKKTTNELCQRIEQEMKDGKTANTLKFINDVPNLIAQIDQELESYSKVERE